MARQCEECGYKMPMFAPRRRAVDGRLLCPGCHPDGRGEPGRPVGLHGSLSTLDEALGMVEEAGFDVTVPGGGMALPTGRIPPFDVPRGPVAIHAPRAVEARAVECPDCNGAGCPKCGGEGTVEAVGDMQDALKDMLSRMPRKATVQVSHAEIVGGLVDEDGAPIGPRAAGVKVAHDSGDGATIYHCPFCGAGQVTARSDGTVECAFCKTFFTVQVQPEHSAMPQTIDGRPFPVPGMPGDPNERGPVPPESQPTSGDALNGAPAFKPPGQPAAQGDAFVPPARQQVPQQAAASIAPTGATAADADWEEGPVDGKCALCDCKAIGRLFGFRVCPYHKDHGEDDPPCPDCGQPRVAFYVTKDGVALPEGSYIHHLAIHFADDRDAVIEQVKAGREA